MDTDIQTLKKKRRDAENAELRGDFPGAFGCGFAALRLCVKIKFLSVSIRVHPWLMVSLRLGLFTSLR